MLIKVRFVYAGIPATSQQPLVDVCIPFRVRSRPCKSCHVRSDFVVAYPNAITSEVTLSGVADITTLANPVEE